MHTQAGDKIMYISASFGEEVWEAKNFGQVMYAIKTRNGQVYLKMLKRGGDMSFLEVRVLGHATRSPCGSSAPSDGQYRPFDGAQPFWRPVQVGEEAMEQGVAAVTPP